jgi:hypothetical protein
VPDSISLGEFINQALLVPHKLGLWPVENEAAVRKLWVCARHAPADPSLFAPQRALIWNAGECPRDLLAFLVLKQNVIGLNQEAISALFNHSHDRCFCASCCRERNEPLARMHGDPARPHLTPVGWMRFGVQIDEAFARTHHVMRDWHVSYHAAPISAVQAILEAGCRVARAGDVVLGGWQLGVQKGHITKAFERVNRFTQSKELFDPTNMFFSSPSIKYCELPCYAKPIGIRDPAVSDRSLCLRFAFELRQRPGSYGIGQETVGATAQLDPRISNNELEYYTKELPAVVITGLCIEVHFTGSKTNPCQGLARSIPQCTQCASNPTGRPTE